MREVAFAVDADNPAVAMMQVCWWQLAVDEEVRSVRAVVFWRRAEWVPRRKRLGIEWIAFTVEAPPPDLVLVNDAGHQFTATRSSQCFWWNIPPTSTPLNCVPGRYAARP